MEERESLKEKTGTCRAVLPVPLEAARVVCGEPELSPWMPKPVAVNTVEKIPGSRSHYRTLN